MIMDHGRGTVITAWHELRHHIYSVRAVKVPSEVEQQILTQIFAYVVNVKAEETDWIIVGSLLKREAEQLIYSSLGGKGRITIDISNIFTSLENITDDLHHLGNSIPQRIIDTILLRSPSLQQLAFRINRLCAMEGK